MPPLGLPIPQNVPVALPLAVMDRESDSKTERPRGKSLQTARARARVLIIVAAGLSLIGSVILYFSGNENGGIFMGLWVPSILALGALIVPAGRD